jgi:hypothetical protein
MEKMIEEKERNRHENTDVVTSRYKYAVFICSNASCCSLYAAYFFKT